MNDGPDSPQPPRPADDSDWRLQGQERYLHGVTLRRKRYSPPRPGWDHDHCEFCSVKFMATDHPGVVREGYATLDDYRWICERCFADFRARFGWTLAAPGPGVA
jgi:hypothetical protein